MLSALPRVTLVDVLDILVVALLVYGILRFIRGTRAARILAGLLLLLGLYALSRRIGMVTFPWVVGNVLGSFFVILVVVFQSEIRRGLARVGTARLLGRIAPGPRPEFLDDLARAAFRLSASRTGALILLERGAGLPEYAEAGREIDALFSPELLAALLSPQSPLHDGAVVIREERVAAAGVILPVPAEGAARTTAGTRHRAAQAVAAETDAVAVVVSEETGRVTVFRGAGATPADDAEALRRLLGEHLGGGRGGGSGA